MIVREFRQLISTDRHVDWGNGTSTRLLVADDGRGYTVTDTFARAGTRTLLRYDNHLEACYCVEGAGTLEVDGETHELMPGLLYAPDLGEEHTLIAGPSGIRLICVFNPPLTGNESHQIAADAPSGY